MRITSVITVKGVIYDAIVDDTTTGAINSKEPLENWSPGGEAIGTFRGSCTITGIETSLCVYELYICTAEDMCVNEEIEEDDVGGLMIRAPLFANPDVHYGIVTGTSFDYASYKTGSVMMESDAEEPYLFMEAEVLATLYK